MSGKCFTKYYIMAYVIIANTNKVTSNESKLNDNESTTPSDCWITLDAKKHFKIMDRLDKNYEDVRHKFQAAVGNDKFDKEMIEVMIKSKGAAIRAIHNLNGDFNLIPAGLNLGGYGMLRLEKSILFFHRLKLRNDTHFQLNYLSNDLFNMTLNAVLSLNDLHLVGSYERVLTGNQRSSFIYAPTHGGVEFLLKDVNYKMEGRYRLLNDRLVIEHVLSKINTRKVMMTFASSGKTHNKQAVPLLANSLEEFLERLKIDIDEWLKDYFNDYLMYFGLAESSTNAEFQEYDKKKTTALNDYVDDVTRTLRQRILKVNAAHLKVPKFQFYGPNGVQIKLRTGTLRGLDTLYRRSVATGRKYNDHRKVDAIIGFSKLKVEYAYEIVVSSMNSPLNGKIIMSADEMTAHMGLTLLEEPEAVDISFDFLQQMKPESLTLEGPASRLIANFKHLLEYHIIAVLTNTVNYSVKQLSTLAKCEPFLPGQTDPNEDDNIDDDEQPNNHDQNRPLQNNKIIKNDDNEKNNNSIDPVKKSDESRNNSKQGSDIEKQNKKQRHNVQNSESGDRKETLGGAINKFVKNIDKGLLGDVMVQKNESMEILQNGKKLHLNFDENIEFRKLKEGEEKNLKSAKKLIKIKPGTSKTSSKSDYVEKSIKPLDQNLKDNMYMHRVDSAEVELPKDLAQHFNVHKAHLNREQNITLSKV